MIINYLRQHPEYHEKINTKNEKNLFAVFELFWEIFQN
jgi:hypothetical protein